MNLTTQVSENEATYQFTGLRDPLLGNLALFVDFRRRPDIFDYRGMGLAIQLAIPQVHT